MAIHRGWFFVYLRGIFLSYISIQHFKGFLVLQVLLAEKLINTARVLERQSLYENVPHLLKYKNIFHEMGNNTPSFYNALECISLLKTLLCKIMQNEVF